MLRRLGFLVALVLALPVAAAGQIAGPPHIFVTGTTIQASEVNANFAAVYAAALNRTGGTMTGALLFSADTTHDIGASGTTRPRDFHLGRNAAIAGTLAVTGATTLTGALGLNNVLTVTSTTAPQVIARYDSSNRLELSVSAAGAATLNAVGASQGVSISDPVTVPAFTATGAGTITGAWTFSNASGLVITNTEPYLWLNETGATANEGKWRWIANADVLTLQTINDAETVAGNILQIGRTGTTVDTVDLFASAIRFFNASGTQRWGIDSSGHFAPASDGAYDIGSGTAGVNNLYIDATVTDVSPQFRVQGDTDHDTGLGFDATGWFFVTNAARTFELPFAGGAALSGNLTVTGNMTVSGTSSITLTASLFAALGTPANGTLRYCSDCTVTNPCAGSGGGALAKRIGAAWVCN